mmetsp:Transcript_61632/g.199581  ORF Transcript_61632/g.199581 Transcript_61632/m.199581 type:complete len:202 (-) Transcript_61632:165-770(-)
MASRPWLVTCTLICICRGFAGGDELPKDVAELRSRIGADLACSACAHATASLRMLLGSKVKTSMKKKDKRRAAKEALAAACEEARFPTQLATVGDEGSRRFGDLQELQQKGGSMNNLKMSPANQRDVALMCSALARHFGSDVVEQALVATLESVNVVTPSSGTHAFLQFWIQPRALVVCEAIAAVRENDDAPQLRRRRCGG